MLELADDIVFGLRAMMKAVSAPEGVILIEDNKPDAIALMEEGREKVAPYDNIRVCAAKTQYPEGAEKMLIKKVMGRQVPSGKLPADVGCVVSNTSHRQGHFRRHPEGSASGGACGLRHRRVHPQSRQLHRQARRPASGSSITAAASPATTWC
ncbi:MAG: hypothetical protein V8T48_00390 [Oscillospiraceae bacterium]